MASWKAKISQIPNEVDKVFEFKSDAGDGDLDNMDVFGVLVDQPVSGSIVHPDFDNRYIVGFSNICTHLGCRLIDKIAELNRDQQTNDLICGPCPCHGTRFNLSKRGTVILGPASQHLPQLDLSLSADRRTIAGKFPVGDGDPTKENWPN